MTLPGPGSPILGSHSVPLVAVSEPQRSFILSNHHWGMGWGRNGLGEIPFDYFDRYMTEAWAIDETKPELPSGVGPASWRWEKDVPGGLHFGLEIYDPSEDERIGWSFAAVRDGSLEVDEIYVRPAYRRCGYGTQLSGMLLGLAEEKNVPIWLWIPYADATQENRASLESIIKKLDLGIHRSGVRWAAYKATREEPRIISFPFIRIPEKPAATVNAGKELQHIHTLNGSVLRYDDPFGSAVAESDWGAGA